MESKSDYFWNPKGKGSPSQVKKLDNGLKVDFIALDEIDNSTLDNVSMKAIDWQPKETAPKDGSWFLVAETMYNSSEILDYQFAVWDSTDNRFMDVNADRLHFDWWMPLPEFPVIKTNG